MELTGLFNLIIINRKLRKNVKRNMEQIMLCKLLKFDNI